jgi:hypothetical protein
MAMKKPHNSWARARKVATTDTAKAKRTAEVVNIAQWAKGKAELAPKDAK